MAGAGGAGDAAAGQGAGDAAAGQGISMPEDARIATVGSPSSTTSLSLEILAGSARKKLVGELAWLEFEQDGMPHRTLGQITEVVLSNMMLELPPMRSLARQRGPINPVSGNQDTHRGVMSIGATFADMGARHEQAVMGTVPPTGTYVGRADDGVLGALLSRFRDRLFYLGRFYESKTRLPMWFPHFGDPDEGGAGEAYHIGVYGKTGSGKSTLAKMLLVAYARHPQMSVFVLDPSGEFARAAGGKTGREVFRMDLGAVCASLGKDVRIYGLDGLVLDRWDLFYELLAASPFFKSLVPGRRNRDAAMDLIKTEFSGEGSVKLNKLHEKPSFDLFMSILADDGNQLEIYSTPTSRESFTGRVASASQKAYGRQWKPLAELFNDKGKTKVSKAVRESCEHGTNRPIVIINLSQENMPREMLWNESIRAIVIRRIVDEIVRQGRNSYGKGEFLNTLVILDEAQRLVPREKYDDERRDKLREDLIDAVQTTRKYGLGWMFLSTSLSTLHRDIYHENRISFYGFGLTSAAEAGTLREIVPDKESLGLYQSFRDPHSAADAKSRAYSFMSMGPVSPLSFAGRPMFLTAFGSGDFAKENGLAAGGDGGPYQAAARGNDQREGGGAARATS